MVAALQGGSMTRAELAAKIDHTILKPEATAEDVRQIVDQAIRFGFASVCVQPIWVATVARQLSGTRVLTCSVAGFPHGANKPTVKAIEASAAVKDGAQEIDVVAHLPHLARHDFAAAKAELTEVVRACRAVRADTVVKVIVESAYLMTLGAGAGERAIELACRAVRESGADFIKTSTGFHPAGGANLEAVRLMKKHAAGIAVKASGGIRDLPTALAMLEAGADRLGLSASVTIVEAYNG
jgi:deoxyribose-phosphate aldolase